MRTWIFKRFQARGCSSSPSPSPGVMLRACRRAQNHGVLPLAGNNALHDVLVWVLPLPTTRLPSRRLDGPVWLTSFLSRKCVKVTTQNMPINSPSQNSLFPFRASLTSFCRYCRISFCFAYSNCRRSSCERFLTLTSTFLLLSWFAMNCPDRFTERFCWDALLVSSMLRKNGS